MNWAKKGRVFRNGPTLLIPESCMKINEKIKASDSCKIQVIGRLIYFIA